MNDKTIDAKISISEDLGSRADGAIRDFWTTGRSVRQAGAVTGSGRILDGAVKSYEIRTNPSCRDVASTSANGSLHVFIRPFPQGPIRLMSFDTKGRNNAHGCDVSLMAELR